IASVLQALADVWDDLPRLVGAGWADLQRWLEAQLKLLEATTNPGEQLWLVNEILTQLSDHKDAYRRLNLRRQELDREAGGGYETIPTPDRSGPIGDALKSLLSVIRSPEVTRHADVLCPRRICIKDTRVPVVVRLKVAPSPDGPGQAPVTVRAGKRVCVHL